MSIFDDIIKTITSTADELFSKGYLLIAAGVLLLIVLYALFIA